VALAAAVLAGAKGLAAARAEFGVPGSSTAAAAAGVAGEQHDLDVAAAADALADANAGVGGRGGAAQVVLPAAVAILRMIQVGCPSKTKNDITNLVVQPEQLEA
jgi:hypothetical protein